VLFADELVKAYPDAKVLLTTRDSESWLASMKKSFYEILSWPSWTYMVTIDRSHSRDYIPLIEAPLNILTDGEPEDFEKLKQGFEEHNAHIRSIVPKERLLEWHPREGWAPLCEFLDVPVPEGEEFPKINEGEFAAVLHLWMIYGRCIAVLQGFALKMSPVVVAFVAYLFYSWGWLDEYL
jgi:hypothetical protein